MIASEGEGRSEMALTEIVAPIDSFDGSTVFHAVTGVLGFVLYMHQQIPSVLQDITLEFEMLRAEYQELEAGLSQTDSKASTRRRGHATRMREVKIGIRRLGNLVNTISSVEAALQGVISEVPNVQRVMLVLGASPIRPQHVYEVWFSHGNVFPACARARDFTKSKAAEGLSRKAIRTLISKGAGSNTSAGPAKLFLLVQAPSSFSLPLHFLPKRDFKYSKKIVPFILHIKCRNRNQEIDGPRHDSQLASHSLTDSTTNDLIWFQCQHVIKGIICKTPSDA